MSLNSEKLSLSPDDPVYLVFDKTLLPIAATFIRYEPDGCTLVNWEGEGAVRVDTDCVFASLPAAKTALLTRVQTRRNSLLAEVNALIMQEVAVTHYTDKALTVTRAWPQVTTPMKDV